MHSVSMLVLLLTFASFNLSLLSKYNKVIDRNDLQSVSMSLREEAKQAFLHSFDGYIKYAFPYDELKPLSCEPRDYVNRSRGNLDDVLGGYMLTLLDSLDTLIVLKEHNRFIDAINKIINYNLTFNRDVTISTFEVNIRILGGLLSAHQLASNIYPVNVYDGMLLLNLAEDLGNRLLTAFSSNSGIPYHRTNLIKGVINESVETCTAAGTSFLLEMSMLSHLTNNQIYKKSAKKALMAVWNKRSSLNLVGAMINVQTSKWSQTHTGIGAGIDSFYETILKSALLLGDYELLDIFYEAYNAVQKHMWFQKEKHHREISMYNRSMVYSNVISSLQAFWPALQVLSGNVNDAIITFDSLEKIWDAYNCLPDMYDIYNKKLYRYGRDYPLRPEMVESAYYLYSATKDPKYLAFGKKVLKLLKKCKTSCGYASIADVSTYKLDDRMDSYFLAETLKYLYLLFDEALDPSMKNSIFCVEDIGNVTISNNVTYVKETLVYETIEKEHELPILPDHNLNIYSDSNSDLLINQAFNWIKKSKNTKTTETNENYNSYDNICIPKLSTLFTTEGHIFIIDSNIKKNKNINSKKYKSNSSNHMCLLDFDLN